MRQRELVKYLGPIDLYLLDQVLRGRMQPGDRILDAGCGDGRNHLLFLRLGYEVHATDRSPDALKEALTHARATVPRYPADRFREGRLESLPWPDEHFNAVVCVAVLHFAKDAKHFRQKMDECWRVLRPGGLFFSRLASKTGQGRALKSLGNRRFRMPDGTNRFIVDERFLEAEEKRLNAERADPLKSLVLHGKRTMDTWVLRKR